MSEELRELAAAGIARQDDGQAKEKRIKLKSYDQMPHQLLNANGESGINETTLPKLSSAMASGNKAVAYFSELCDPIQKRKGIAISRLSEVQLKNGEKLQHDNYKNNINTKLYEAAMKEFKALEPSFRVLMGKGISMDDDDTVETVGRIAYGSSSNKDYKKAEDVNQAVKVVYEWLEQPASKLRSLTALLSGGALFYVASVHEKCHRAYINHGYTMDDKQEKVTEEDYADWARARLCNNKTVAHCGDLDGLK